MSKRLKISLMIIVALLFLVISAKFWGPWLQNNLKDKIESWLNQKETSQLETSKQISEKITAPAKPDYLLAVEVTMENLKDEDKVVKASQEIGAKAIFIFLPVLDNEEPTTMLGYTKNLITASHQKGIATGLVLDTIISWQNKSGKPEYPQVLAIMNKYLIEAVKFAEEQGLAYLEVAAEADNILEMTKTESQTPALIKELLKTVRNSNYSGEVGVGFDICNQATPSKCRLSTFDYDLTDYDFSSTSIYLSGQEEKISQPIDQYLPYLEPLISSLKNNNQKYGVKKTYQLINAGSVWAQDTRGCEEVKDLCYPFTASEEAEFYQKTLPKTKPMVDGLIVPYSALDNKQAQQAIKEFYQSF